MKKNLLVSIILIALVLVNIHSVGQSYSTSIFLIQENGQTLYVGGNGSGNYSKIQDAVSSASNGDTIFVYQKVYYENVYVDKSITLIGQNRKNTIIDGSHGNTHSILLEADGITVNGFTIQNDGGPNGETACYVYCNDCHISNCSIQTSQHTTMRIQSSSNNTIFNCSIFGYPEFGGDDAIKLLDSFQNTFVNCEIGNSHRFGALISGSYNAFLNCSIFNNGEAGVRMSGNNQFFSGCLFFDNGIGFKIDESRDHKIINCRIYQNNEGIRLWQYHPVNITIRNCDIYNNSNYGIRIIEETEQTTIDACRVHDNGVDIVISDNCLYNKISNSTIFNSTYGIEILSNSNHNIIKNCTSYNNSYYGFYIDESDGNQIINSTASFNGNGTYIGTGCHKNIFWRCTVNNNRNYGLRVQCPTPYSSDENSITYNVFKNNRGYAVYIDGYCFRNALHHNVFIDVFKEVYDTSSNYWDDGTEGNYYSKYHGEDHNHDGIGDRPYYIGRYNFDHFPLMFTQMEDPKITIMNPKSGFLYLGNHKIFPIFFTTLLLGACNVTANVYSQNITDIIRVEFSVDDSVKEVDTTAPYSWIWKEISFGKHVLKATAFITNGNYSSNQIVVWKFL